MTKELSLLSRDMYHAAVDPERWASLLDRIAREAGARGSAIISLNTVSSEDHAASWCSSLYADDRLAYYSANLAHHEREIFDLALASKPGEPLVDPELVRDPVAAARRPDIAYLQRRYDVLHRLAMRLNDDRGWFHSIAVQFATAHGPPRAHEIELLGRLRPHLAQTMQLARAFRQLRERYGAVLGALDRLRLAVFIVTDGARVVTRNRTAERLLEGGRAVRIDRDAVLRPIDGAAAARLRTAIDAVLRTARRGGDCSRRLVALRGDGPDTPFVVEVSPLQDSDRELDEPLGGAFVTVIDPWSGDPVDLSGFDRAYGLTSAEAAVARLVVDGMTYAEIAERRNVTRETVKSHVGSLLRKTGSRNRTDLVRRALLLNAPLDSSAPAVTLDRGGSR